MKESHRCWTGRGLSVAFVLTIAVAGVLPATALASRAQISKNKLIFTARGGETNQVVIKDDPTFEGYLVTDIGNTITPKPDPRDPAAGCLSFQNSSNTVDCKTSAGSDFFTEIVRATTGDQNDSFYGQADLAYNVVGGAGNDSLFGNVEPDVLIGSSGDDYLDGGDEEDKLVGSGGIDTFFATDDYVDTIYCDRADNQPVADDGTNPSGEPDVIKGSCAH
jgi:Ca2+-binding RTX toxin-like protein